MPRARFAATDGYFAYDLYERRDDPDAPPIGFFAAVVLFILACAIMLAAIDLTTAGGMGWRGALLDLTYTRVAYSTFLVLFGSRGTAAAASRSTSDVKLLEAVFESMPQLFLQATVQLAYPAFVGDPTGITAIVFQISLAASALSTAASTSAKMLEIFEAGGGACKSLAVGMYFAADVVSRSALAF